MRVTTLRRTLPLTAVLAVGLIPGHGIAASVDLPPVVGKIGNELANVLNGTKGKDVMQGLDGNDKMNGGRGNDQVDGGSGNDNLKGGAGNDTVEGRSGNDKIHGGSGKDKLDGGSGNDRIQARDKHADEIFCGSGKDTVTVDKKDLVSRTCEKVNAPKKAKIKRF